MVEVLYGELVEERATNFEYNPFADGTVEQRERQQNVGLAPTTGGNLSSRPEPISRLPQLGQSNREYARQQWSQSDEKLVRDLERIDRDYDRTIRDIDSDAAVARAELDAERRRLNLPSKQRGDRVGQASRVAAGIGAAIDGVSAYRERRAGGAGFGESVGAAAGRVAGAAGGGQLGGTLGGAGAVALQGPGAAEPVSSVGGAAIGGALGTLAGAAAGGAAGESLGGAIGRGLDKFADWINPFNDGHQDPMEDSQPTNEGQPTYDPSKPGGLEGGQCAVEYRVRPKTSAFGPFAVSRTARGPFSNPQVSKSQSGRGCDYSLSVDDVNGNTISWNGRFTGSYENCADSGSLSFWFERRDGLPDNCGNLPNTKLPDTREPRTKPRFGLPIGLPSFDLPDGIELPDFTRDRPSDPTERPGFDPIPLPDFPDQIPPKRDPFGDTPTGRPEPDDRPGLEPDGGGGGGGGGGDDDDEECNVCEKLDQILELLNVSDSFAGVFTACEEDLENTPGFLLDSTEFLDKPGLRSITSQNKLITDALVEIWNKVKCPPPEMSGSIPETFIAKAPTIKPQLQVIFREKGKKNASKWHLTIPHFNQALKDSINIPDYRKGNVRCVLTLRDNSKIVVNAVNESEGRKMVSAALTYVLPNMKAPISEMSSHHIPSRDLRKVEVEAFFAKYFSGSLEDPPKWTRKLT